MGDEGEPVVGPQGKCFMPVSSGHFCTASKQPYGWSGIQKVQCACVMGHLDDAGSFRMGSRNGMGFRLYKLAMGQQGIKLMGA
eukprot:scaffold57533_cov22-Tisochrysis_lutea.AAC.3